MLILKIAPNFMTVVPVVAGFSFNLKAQNTYLLIIAIYYLKIFFIYNKKRRKNYKKNSFAYKELNFVLKSDNY